MSLRLLIHYAGTGEPLAWIALDERGRAAGTGTREHAPPASALRLVSAVVVVVPGSDVLLASTRVAARSREQLARAVPFALEEQFAEPVEQLQVAFVARNDGSQDVAAVRADTLRAWLDDLASRGIQADWLVPEPLALPWSPEAATVLIDGDRAIARHARHDGLVVSTAQLPELLALADLPRDAQGRIAVRLLASARTDLAFDTNFAVQVDRDDVTPLAAFAQGTTSSALAHLPNLASGRFAPKHRGAPVLRWWRLAALLAGVALVLAFAAALADRWSLSRQVAALDAAKLDVYRQVYPDGVVVPDLAGRMRGDYNAGRGMTSSGALSLLARVAPAVMQNSRVAVKGIEYRGGTLDLTLLAAGVQDLDAARERAATLPGLRAELAAASTNERGAEGRLRVTEGAP